MNILIKLTCLVGLVIAPILGNGHGSSNTGTEKEGCCQKKEMCHGDKKCHTNETCDPHKKGEYMIGKCDMRKCANMTKDECAKMCDSLGCTKEQKDMCLAHYGADGKFKGMPENSNCCSPKMKKECCKKDATHKH